MKIVLFYHSLLSDWNHGNAHFLRGLVSELQARGMQVEVFEPEDGWSRCNQSAERRRSEWRAFSDVYPRLRSTLYRREGLDLAAALEGADLVLVHEWNDSELVAAIGRVRAAGAGFRLIFHDTHHRAATSPEQMARYDLSAYDGVLAFGEVLRDLYLVRGWAGRVWTWHEAADIRVFRPAAESRRTGDLVWIGNWGDEERTAELHEFLLEPVKALGLQARVYGVRYPDSALRALARAGIEYCGWIPNYEVPSIFAQHRLTVHIPRRPYVHALPGIPTIRPFEALACGIPLISTGWEDAENLFSPGSDFIMVRSAKQMRRSLESLLKNPQAAERFSRRGLETIRRRHTCGHRVDELLSIYHSLQGLQLQPLASGS